MQTALIIAKQNFLCPKKRKRLEKTLSYLEFFFRHNFYGPLSPRFFLLAKNSGRTGPPI